MRWLLVLLILPVLFSCNAEHGSGVVVDANGTGSVSLEKPAFLAQLRTIDPSQLKVEVAINGNGVTLQPDDSGRYVGETTVPSEGDSTITVLWSTLQDLPLAQAEKTFNGADGSVTVFDGDYDKSFDADEDDRTNIAELEAGTDPLDASDPAEPVVRVPLTLRIELPQQLANADQAVQENVFAEATVNALSSTGGAVILNRSGNVWTGETTVPQNSEVSASVTFYPSSNRGYVLAQLMLNQPIGEDGGSILFQASQYNTDFDADSDSLSNIEELAQGSDPTDSSSPAQDPCVADPSAAGCANTDGGDDSGGTTGTTTGDTTSGGTTGTTTGETTTGGTDGTTTGNTTTGGTTGTTTGDTTTGGTTGTTTGDTTTGGTTGTTTGDTTTGGTTTGNTTTGGTTGTTSGDTTTGDTTGTTTGDTTTGGTTGTTSGDTTTDGTTGTTSGDTTTDGTTGTTSGDTTTGGTTGTTSGDTTTGDTDGTAADGDADAGITGGETESNAEPGTDTTTGTPGTTSDDDPTSGSTT